MDVFKLESDVPFYNGLLKHKEYYERAHGIKYKIVYMTPDEYIKKVAELQGTPVYLQMMMISNDIVNSYVELAKKGTKFPILILDYRNKYQEGRHRAIMAKRLGIEKIPVMVVEEE